MNMTNIHKCPLDESVEYSLAETQVSLSSAKRNLDTFDNQLGSS